ncbi:hypothetical protein CHLNCDRAFT_134618 [Chlorella variabilis]|uniref:F-box domain-containing protein n=1 Tax=Chlorella variabilis TaxID=554065 RepID=E1ZGD0_CHLVA|nr:hypothetical protein CHLNCDRAFT_134618 [Chlorella variabilis]EFN54736.1 hypothetical protein CHLNCDRAFT_134618 [Chlorella variabilis]|eukprot:XP_005846838.1 hypothetical protein CHLNCDRAFT_134618 [Chlorella variabilis]
MKLRVKHASGQRIALQVSNNATLGELHAQVAHAVLGAPTAGVTLSFNNKDPLLGAPNTPLSELGVANGDLLWLMTPPQPPQQQEPGAATKPAAPEAKRARDRGADANTMPPAAQGFSTLQQDSGKGKKVLVGTAPAPAGCSGLEQGVQQQAAEVQEHLELLATSQRVPTYLLRTLQHSCTQHTQPAELLMLAAHAAMLETGFVPSWVALPAGSGSIYHVAMSGSCWATRSICRIRYHLANGGSMMTEATQVAGGTSEQQQGPAFTLQCSSLGGGVVLALDPASTRRLWTALKDGLAFPMLLAAYAEAGLPPPVGLLALPEDIKHRLLELVEAQDLASLCCTCSELRHLASQDELWRPLFEREFPHAPPYFTAQAQQGRGYKWAFAQCWRERRQREEALRRVRARSFMPAVPHFGVPRPPFYPPPLRPGYPGIVGGDFDRLPQFASMYHKCAYL